MSLLWAVLACWWSEPVVVRSAIGTAQETVKSARDEDTGWWAPVPTYDCPEPERTPDLLVEQRGGYGTVRWWDSNVIAWPAYTEFELSTANYLSACDAGNDSSVTEAGAGAAEVDARWTMSNRSPAEFIGLHNPEADGASLYAYVYYTLDGISSYSGIYSSYGPEADEFDAVLCVGTLTPDRLSGSMSFDVDSGGEALFVHITFDLQRDDSLYWKEYGDAPCLNVYHFAPAEDLTWSGAWP